MVAFCTVVAVEKASVAGRGKRRSPRRATRTKKADALEHVVTLRLPAEIYERAATQAAADHRTLSAYLRLLVLKHLPAEKDREPSR